MRTVLILFYISLKVGLAGDLPPTQVKNCIYKTFNRSAGLSTSEYSIENARDLEDYIKDLKFNPNRLKKGDLVIDVGGGLAIAGLELVRDYGVHVVVINTQDYYGVIRSWEKLDDQELYAKILWNENLFQLNVDQIDGIPAKSLDQIAHVFEMGSDAFSYKNSKNQDPKIIIKKIRLLNSHLKNISGPGKFDYRAGYAEEILDSFFNQAQAVLDEFGAAYYSPEKVLLFEKYYRALEPGREVKMFLAGFQDEVLMEDGTKKGLLNFLVERYPQIFSFHSQHLITIHKPYAFFPELKIPLRIKNLPDLKDVKISPPPKVLWEFDPGLKAMENRVQFSIQKTKNRFFVSETIPATAPNEVNCVFHFSASVDENGVLAIFTVLKQGRCRSHTLRGTELYDEMMKHFKEVGTPIHKILDLYWSKGDNYTQFNQALKEGKTPEEAAKSTWAGKQAARYGFTKAEIKRNHNFSDHTKNYDVDVYWSKEDK